MCWPTKIKVTLLGVLLTALSGVMGLRCLCQPMSAAGAQDGAVSRLMQSAQARLGRGDLEGAAAKLEQALAQDERNKAARTTLCHALIRLARLPEADRQIEFLRRQFTDEAEPL